MSAIWAVLLGSLGLLTGGMAQPQTMTRGEYLAGSGKIVMEHRAARTACGTQTSTAATMCRIDAANTANIAAATLHAQYKPGADALSEVERAKIEAAYTTARERCNALASKPKLACVEQAEVERLNAAQRLN